MATGDLRAELTELASNLWWCWNNDAIALWNRAAEELPESKREALVRNPVELVGALKAKHVASLEADKAFAKSRRAVLARFRRARKPVSRVAGMSWKNPVAYFSMEFGIHESLPIYSGGLGILAGDHLKSASDEGVPLVGIGFLYRRGYYRQELTTNGEMAVKYPSLDFDKTPAEVVKQKNGRPLMVSVDLPTGPVKSKVWKLDVGQIPLYLLDTDIPENKKADRKISHFLYGGTREDRIRQEVVLGIGGVRVLAALGITPSVWHLNEGHVAFLALERLRTLRAKNDHWTPEALEIVASDTLFTTHTPVPEGNEIFDLALVRRYLLAASESAGMGIDDFLQLGLDYGSDDQPIFSMTVLAIRLSRLRNGVSALHGKVARRMWSFLWPAFSSAQCPISSVTNGVHTTSWIAPEIEALYDDTLGPEWRTRLADTRSEFWKTAKKIPSRALWDVKQKLKEDLVAFVRKREDERLEREGMTAGRRAACCENLLDPNAFTIGFARRFALYKRSALLFHDLKRAVKLFSSKKRPVQIIFAGKPHPEDPEGTKVYEAVAKIAKRPEFRGKVVLLENYDTEVCRYMVRGVDVWLNNPRRPLEASGTSGQKVPVNGGLNVSILDGWWEEGYAPDTGWAFGKAEEYDDPDEQDDEDAASMYRVFEKEVIPLYYDRAAGGVPTKWVTKLKSSMVPLVPEYSSNRMVVEYADRFYLPALRHGKAMNAKRGALARDIATWRDQVEDRAALFSLRGGVPGPAGSLRVEAFLGGVDPACFRCWAEDGDEYEVTPEKEADSGVWILRIAGIAKLKEGPKIYRLFPSHPGLMHPQELGIALEFEFG